MERNYKYILLFLFIFVALFVGTDSRIIHVSKTQVWSGGTGLRGRGRELQDSGVTYGTLKPQKPQPYKPRQPYRARQAYRPRQPYRPPSPVMNPGVNNNPHG